jgi:hypothetical protein
MALCLKYVVRSYSIIVSKSMGSVIENKKVKVITKNRQVKTKGDRLGWTLRSEVKHVPLREIAGRGKIVNETCCFISTTAKMIM